MRATNGRKERGDWTGECDYDGSGRVPGGRLDGCDLAGEDDLTAEDD